MHSLAFSHRQLKMNYKNKIPLFAIVALSFIIPQAFADVVVDNFSDGAAMVNDGGNCTFSDDPATVLGGTRGIFACIDSVAGLVTSETDTTPQHFIFTINNADGSSGLNYDNGGLLLGGADITEGNVNNALRLDFIKADDMREGTVVVTDMNNIVGIFEFDILQDANPFSETIAFAAINDLPSSMDIPDFANLQSINIFFEKEQSGSGDKELILGQITALSIPGLDTDDDGTPDIDDGCPLDPNKTAPGINGCGVPDNGGVPPEECPPGQVGTPPDDCSPLVGGSLIPIDMTMVLLAGAQSISAWMIPVIVAGTGFAIVIARKF